METASPTQAQSQPIQQGNSSATTQHKPTIGTTRACRLLLNIIYQPVPVHDLRAIVGSENIWDEARQLRQRGWLVITTKKTITDRDGLKVSSGNYHLAASQRSFALAAVQAFNEKQEAMLVEGVA